MVALLLHAAFAFVVLGSKLMIALWVIYYLFPRSRACPECDSETLSMTMGLMRRVTGTLLFLGRVRYRWCPECGWAGFVRGPIPVDDLAERRTPSQDPGSVNPSTRRY